MSAISKVLDIALNEVGYLEKASNYNLDSKTGNAGYNNYTKYARDLDNLGNFYNGPKNGYAWCDVFVDWVFVQAFGAELARALLCQPTYSTGAGVYYSAQFYKNKGQFHTSNPQAGDQVFFSNYDHTGLVVEVSGSTIYTVEGNTSSESGVVPNGGAVRKKSYNIYGGLIEGYGRPDWSLAPSEEEPLTFITDNRFLTLEEMQVNARYIWSVLSSKGWTLNAVAGMLGNMQTESTINPGIWQNLNVNYGPAFGLVQWDPYTKYTDWCAERGLDPAHMDSALARIEFEMDTGVQYYATDAYPLSFKQFKVSTKTPNYLGMAFLNNYERPADRDQPKRGTQAEYWFEYLQSVPGGVPVTPPSSRPEWTPTSKKGLPLLLLVSATRRK